MEEILDKTPIVRGDGGDLELPRPFIVTGVGMILEDCKKQLAKRTRPVKWHMLELQFLEFVQSIQSEGGFLFYECPSCDNRI